MPPNGDEYSSALSYPIRQRPTSFDEYLVSIGLADHRVRNYAWRFKKAEMIPAEMGSTLLTANVLGLLVGDGRTLNGWDHSVPENPAVQQVTLSMITWVSGTIDT